MAAAAASDDHGRIKDEGLFFNHSFNIETCLTLLAPIFLLTCGYYLVKLDYVMLISSAILLCVSFFISDFIDSEDVESIRGRLKILECRLKRLELSPEDITTRVVLEVAKEKLKGLNDLESDKETAEKKKLEKKIRALTKDLESERMVYKHRRDNETSEKKKLEEMNRLLKTDLVSEREAFKNAWDQVTKDHVSERKNWMDKETSCKKNFEEKIASLKQELEHEKARNVMLEEGIECVEQELEEEREKIETLEANIEDLEQDLEAEKEKNGTLEDNIEGLEQVLEDEVEKNETLEEKIEGLEQELEDQKAKNKSLEETIESVEQKLEEEKAKNKMVEEEVVDEDANQDSVQDMNNSEKISGRSECLLRDTELERLKEFQDERFFLHERFLLEEADGTSDDDDYQIVEFLTHIGVRLNY